MNDYAFPGTARLRPLDPSGSDDLGSIARITNAATLRGAAAIRTGERVNLNLPVDAFDPPLSHRRGVPTHSVVDLGAQVRDDRLDGLYLQGSTQIDGLRHFRHADGRFYDGVADSELQSTSRLGIEHLVEHGIATRGVLIDLAAQGAGEASYDPLTSRVAGSDLDRALDAQQVHVEPGDAILLHTGWIDVVFGPGTSHRRSPVALDCAGLEQSMSMVDWLRDRRPSLLAADNPSVEAFPPDPTWRGADVGDPAAAMLHGVLIADLGLVLGELWDLRSLTERCQRDRRWDFLLVVVPLLVVGGVGAPANCVAIR